jgi:predicted N-acetyltransferase YhbS
MAIELVPAEPQHARELGSICFEAFKELQDRACGTRDFPTVEIAQQVLGMLVERDDFYSVSALENGRLVGSNFLSLMDLVAGVGPVTVDPSYQGQGLGRILMQDVIDYARHHNIEQVRLMQDSLTQPHCRSTLHWDST